MELELIQGCISEDRASQRQLFETYSRKFMAICKRYMQDDMQAEDVLMESFLKIYNNIKKFKAEGSFEGWMRRIVVNTAIDHVNKKNRSLLRYCEEVNDEVTVPASAIADLSANELMLMVCELPVGCRTVFNMFVMDGFTHKQISEHLKIPEGTSKWHMSQARILLQEKLKRYESNVRI
jgi:RNA polymerase sigma-70 factor (ECF subfamily)